MAAMLQHRSWNLASSPALAPSRRLCRRAAPRLVAGQHPAGGGRARASRADRRGRARPSSRAADDREAKARPRHPARRLAGGAPAGLSCAGCGTANSAADRLSLAARHLGPAAPIAWATSATPSCRGSAGGAMPRGRWRCCCRKRARKASTYVELTTDPGQSPVAEGDHGQWRRPGEALPQGTGLRRGRSPAVPDPALTAAAARPHHGLDHGRQRWPGRAP